MYTLCLLAQAAPATDWTALSGDAWVRGIGAALVALLAWLLRELVKAVGDSRQDYAKVLERLEARNVALQAQHHDDMQLLLGEAAEDRKTYDRGFKEIADSIRDLTIAIRDSDAGGKGGQP